MNRVERVSGNGHTKKVTARAPGKLILLGEYAVLEGAPALVTAVNRFTRVSVEDSGDSGPGYSVESPLMGVPPIEFKTGAGGGPVYAHADSDVVEKLRFFSAAFKYSHELLERFDHVVPPCRILLDTSDFYNGQPPVKMGFGSSASLTLATIRALVHAATGAFAHAATGALPEIKQLYRAALAAHHHAQGRAGSGIDVAAATWGGLLEFRIGKPGKSLRLPRDLHFVTVWTGTPASTTQLLNDVARFKEKEPGPYWTIVAEMSRLTSQGIRSLRKNNIPGFLLAVDGYCEAMVRLGDLCGIPVVTGEHRRLARLARDHGTVYKPSGAGGGDCGIAFSISEEAIRNTRTAMKEAGFHCPDIVVSEHGFEIEKVYEES